MRASCAGSAATSRDDDPGARRRASGKCMSLDPRTWPGATYTNVLVGPGRCRSLAASATPGRQACPSQVLVDRGRRPRPVARSRSCDRRSAPSPSGSEIAHAERLRPLYRVMDRLLRGRSRDLGQLPEAIGIGGVRLGSVDGEQLIAVVGEEQRLVVEGHRTDRGVAVGLQAVALLCHVVAFPPAGRELAAEAEL